MLKAFVLGIREYRSDLTTHFNDYGLLLVYDYGRAVARLVIYGNNQ